MCKTRTKNVKKITIVVRYENKYTYTFALKQKPLCVLVNATDFRQNEGTRSTLMMWNEAEVITTACLRNR